MFSGKTLTISMYALNPYYLWLEPGITGITADITSIIFNHLNATPSWVISNGWVQYNGTQVVGGTLGQVCL